mmetsp:Transcript_10766/g.22321  ORF Transcript_10766/g.22321 Transcript_10766/m.22321 type:complete len:195 (+) Transcript_10766:84-668(+)
MVATGLHLLRHGFASISPRFIVASTRSASAPPAPAPPAARGATPSSRFTCRRTGTGAMGAGGKGQHVIDAATQPYHPEKLERKADVPIGDFFKVDIRVGVVTSVEPYPEMRKPSYKLEVDFGPVVGKLWTSAQVTNYAKDELLGRKVVGTVNLGSKTLPKGFVSQFLVMGALNPDGTVQLLQVPEETLPGSAVA